MIVANSMRTDNLPGDLDMHQAQASQRASLPWCQHDCEAGTVIPDIVLHAKRHTSRLHLGATALIAAH